MVIVLVLWQFTGQLNSNIRLLISTPSYIFDYMVSNWYFLIESSVVTLLEACIGLIIAISFSFLTMITCFYFPKFLRFILPLMVSSQVIPLIVLAPFLIILLGPGISSKIVMATLMSFFPIFINFSDGVKAISREIHDLCNVNNSKVWQRIVHVYFPLSLPNILTGIKVATTLAVIGAIVAEFTGSKLGLGKNLFLSAKRLEPELMMSSLILSFFIGGGLYIIVMMIERKIVK